MTFILDDETNLYSEGNFYLVKESGTHLLIEIKNRTILNIHAYFNQNVMEYLYQPPRVLPYNLKNDALNIIFNGKDHPCSLSLTIPHSQTTFDQIIKYVHTIKYH